MIYGAYGAVIGTDNQRPSLVEMRYLLDAIATPWRVFPVALQTRIMARYRCRLLSTIMAASVRDVLGNLSLLVRRR